MSTRSSAGMGRRAFLRVAAATATLAVEHKGSSENLGYVDAHSHLWSPERSRYPLRPGANEADVQPKGFTPGDFFAHARPEGVNRVVIIGHTAHFGFDATYLTDVLKARPRDRRPGLP
jgi:predicted TIM-barrel fold metal-dependent hydrolase